MTQHAFVACESVIPPTSGSFPVLLLCVEYVDCQREELGA